MAAKIQDGRQSFFLIWGPTFAQVSEANFYDRNFLFGMNILYNQEGGRTEPVFLILIFLPQFWMIF